MIEEHVLILGGCGFIGKNLTKKFIEEGYCVHVMDRVRPEFIHSKNMFYCDITLGDTSGLVFYISKYNITKVIHLISSLLPSSNEHDFHNELDKVIYPTFSLIDQIRQMPNVEFIFFSSGGTVYGVSGSRVLSESMHCRPITYYGLSKLFIENYIQTTSSLTDLRYLIVRPSNPYGRFQNIHGAQGFIAVSLGKILKSETIQIWGDGSIIRDYIYIDDLCELVIDLISIGVSNRVINLGSGVGHSLSEVISVLTDVCSNKVVNVEYKKSRSVDIKSNVLDITLLRSFIDYRPTTLAAGISCFYNDVICI
ncbi:NAD-dependent epimerase/dehydratase family protein [Aeromonas veronii]|uniref:NAD-dependent epimerase/dehydratase family protein n=1 Tax=Aeromonas veronii TaxID=654 RepID=UPI002444C117|nr:NAD-dependent epimerase/dehydratase family protein [Aeromonas veronii]